MNPEVTSLLDQPVPKVRQDVELLPAASDVDGYPMYNLFDPIRRKYYLIGWLEGQIFKEIQPGVTYGCLLNSINKKTTVNLTEEGLKSFFMLLSHYHLLEEKYSSEDMLVQEESTKVSAINWLLYHYLYIRIPLCNPDAFLKKTLFLVRPLVSYPAGFIYLLFFIGGLYFLIAKFDQFIHTFTYFFNTSGMISYFAAIVAVKIIHEFSHAYTAAYYGVRVPSMGVAFLVLWPVLYTDMTDSWKLTDRKQRIAISAAGIVAEMILAGIATFVWGITDPGILNSVCFIIASVTWIHTILVNANPAMRYDGYYILCDLVGIDHLQQQAFEHSRWQFRKWFLGLDVPPPQDLPEKRKFWYLLFTIYTIIYRIIIYTAVAFFVYTTFTKALGVLLFCIEIYLFMISPVIYECKELWKIRQNLKPNRRLIATTTAILLFIVWGLIPLPHTVTVAGITYPVNQQVIFSPHDGLITSISVKKGQRVNKGDLLAVIESDKNQADLKSIFSDREKANREVWIATVNKDKRVLLPEKSQVYLAETEKLRNQKELMSQSELRAQVSGRVVFWDENLRDNAPVGKNKPLGKIADLNNIIILCFIPEDDLDSFHVGQEATFYPNGINESLKGRLARILPVRKSDLDFEQLSSLSQGTLPVVKDPKTKKSKLVESYFIGYVKLDEQQKIPWASQRGDLKVTGAYESLFGKYLKMIYHVIWKESNL